MQIIHGLDDLGFKADNLDDLKRQVEDFYSVYGYKPNVMVEDGKVVVTIDTELLDKASEIMKNAIEYCNSGRFNEAMSLLDEAQKLTPCNGDIYRLKAQIYFMRDKDYNLAMDTCIDALRFNPQDYYSLILMGNILMQGKDDGDTAMSYYEKALEYNPDDEIAITNIATIELQKGNYKIANGYYKRLLNMGCKYANLYYSMEISYVQMNQLQEAFETGLKGLKETEDRPENPGIKDKMLKLTYKVASELIKDVNVKHVFEGLKEELEQKLTMPLEVRCDNEMSVYGRMEYGPAHRSNHHVLYYKKIAPNALHTILHEMVHLEMNNNASKCGKNLIMYGTDEQYKEFCRAYQPFIRKIKSRIGSQADAEIQKMFKMFCLLLMNAPLDLFVEKHIYDKYTTLRAFQFVSMYRQAYDYLQSVIDPNVKKMFPEQMMHLTKVCNMVTAMHIKSLYGIDTVMQYKPSSQELARAKDLYDEFLAYSDYKPGEEYEYVDYFMDSLNVKQYFVIRNEAVFTRANNLVDEAYEEDSNHDIEETRKANEEFAKNHPDDASSHETMMMSMYMLGALQELTKIPITEVKNIALEIAMLGVKGIDPNKSGYRVEPLNKAFGGYELLAYYYVSWAIAIPEKLEVLQLPFSEAYRLARQMFEGGEKDDKDHFE